MYNEIENTEKRWFDRIRKFNYKYYDTWWFKHYINKDRCSHQGCPECHGTGRKRNGQTCVHMLSCRCSRCSPHYL